MSEEHVLVITKEKFEQAGAFQGFKEADNKYLEEFFSPGQTKFIPRSEAESDPNFKQLIPYCLFICGSKLSNNRQILIYQRGKSSGEKRLSAKYSLGIGGHINPIDVAEDENGLTAMGYLRAVEREIKEELNIKGNFTIASKGFINDDSNEVGKVHLGVIHVFELDNTDITAGEEAISNLKFIEISELQAKRDELETWSQIILDNLDSIVSDNVNMFLRAFYNEHKAKTTLDKILALRTYFIREPLTISVYTEEAELLALEYYILDQLGFSL